MELYPGIASNIFVYVIQLNITKVCYFNVEGIDICKWRPSLGDRPLHTTQSWETDKLSPYFTSRVVCTC